MGGWNRLEVKQQLLELSQGKDPKIPTLSYVHFETINPYYIDGTLLENLDDGTFVLTDALFFECLQESADYLAYEVFRAKIKTWQEMLNEDWRTQEERSGAKTKLTKVATCLASQGKPGRPPKDSISTISAEYIALYPKLKRFLHETKSRNLIAKVKVQEFTARSEFLKYSQYANLSVRHRAAKELAIQLIAKRRDISVRTIKSALKVLSHSNIPELE